MFLSVPDEPVELTLTVWLCPPALSTSTVWLWEPALVMEWLCDELVETLTVCVWAPAEGMPKNSPMDRPL